MPVNILTFLAVALISGVFVCMLCFVPRQWGPTGLLLGCFAVLFAWLLLTVLRHRRGKDGVRTVDTDLGAGATADEEPSPSNCFTPSLWLLGLTYGWLLPIFCLYAFSNGLGEPRENRSYLLVFCHTLAIALILFLVEFWIGIWRRKGYWKKYFLLAGSYTVNIGGIFLSYLYLEERGLLGYSHGDGAGSFMLLCLPTLAAYWLAGFLVVLSLLARDMIVGMTKKRIG